MKRGRIIFIAGPTASGKSAAALALAKQTGGEIVNADAMQIYRDLRVVTARPTQQDESAVPHHLYGVLDGAVRCSAGRWAQMAVERIDDIAARGAPAILTGGTGLYFKTLEEGLSPVPETPREIREKAHARRRELGAAAFYSEVVRQDPVMARLPEGDAQRLLRAWEVFEATGKPLSYFQNLPRQPFIRDVIEKAALLPPRDRLYAQCDRRAEQMFAQGAADEVEKLIARGLDMSLPIMKALGVPEIAAVLNEAVDRGDALLRLQRNTRRFAKRQTTWFRNQAPHWPCYEEGDAAVTDLTQ